ncbi:MAG: ethanolamine ammonia-lyase subunit EutC [bacterium]
MSKQHITQDYWQELQKHTQARIALGRAGSSLSTQALLDFQLAHAQARDAVHKVLEAASLAIECEKYKLGQHILQSRAADRQTYLLRPDLGRRLHEKSKQLLEKSAAGFDLSLIIADGLSANAVSAGIIPLLDLLIPKLMAQAYRLAPLSIVNQGRVAISDEIGSLQKSKLAVIFLGERPGLSAPDSLGIYLTFGPEVGNTDEKRNCISNVRPAGMPYPLAAEKLSYLIKESLRKKISGVALKDDLQISLKG